MGIPAENPPKLGPKQQIDKGLVIYAVFGIGTNIGVWIRRIEDNDILLGQALQSHLSPVEIRDARLGFLKDRVTFSYCLRIAVGGNAAVVLAASSTTPASSLEVAAATKTQKGLQQNGSED